MNVTAAGPNLQDIDFYMSTAHLAGPELQDIDFYVGTAHLASRISIFTWVPLTGPAQSSRTAVHEPRHESNLAWCLLLHLRLLSGGWPLLREGSGFGSPCTTGLGQPVVIAFVTICIIFLTYPFSNHWPYSIWLDSVANKLPT